MGFFIHQQVLRFEIEVQKPAAVHVAEGRRHLTHQE